MKKIFLTFILAAMSFVTFGQKWTALSSDKPAQPKVKLISSSEEQIVVNFSLGGFNTIRVETPNGTQNIISVPKMASTLIAGAPDLPHFPIPVLIGDMAEMGIKVSNAQFTDFNIEVAPSKGIIKGDVNPDEVPYTYGEMYSQNAFYPAGQAHLEAPYIIRDFRGQNIMVTPFAYNPVTKTLRVFTSMTITMTKLSDNGENPKLARKSNTIKVNPEMKNTYNRRFINFGMQTAKYSFIEDQGEMLVICPEQYMEAMQPFVDWKNKSGRPTTMVSLDEAGGNYDNNIKAYIRNYYDDRDLVFVLLVGDYDDITPHMIDYNYYSDNWFGQLEGDDYYIEAFVGRFSVESVADVETHVNKVLYYERDMPAGLEWLENGVGIGSTDGQGTGHYGESDWRHIEYIRDTLMHYTYWNVSQRYEHYDNPTADDISNDFNNGASICNYCNPKGSETGWGICDFNNARVNALTNDYMWPMIITVSNYSGNFSYGEPCFAETWMRATNSTTNAPTGAIGGMFPWLFQSWNVAQYGQDEMNNILCEYRESDHFNHTMGSCFHNGNEYILDACPEDNGEVHNTWIMFGDPSLMIRTTIPQDMNVTLYPSSPMIGMDELEITITEDDDWYFYQNYAFAILSMDGEIISTQEIIDGNGIMHFDPLTHTGTAELLIIGFNKVTYQAEVEIAPAEGPFLKVVGYTPEIVRVNQLTPVSISFKNIGYDPTEGETQITLSFQDGGWNFFEVIDSTATLGIIQPNETITLENAFSVKTWEYAEDNEAWTVKVKMTCGDKAWHGEITFTAGEAAFEFIGCSYPQGYIPGANITLAPTFKNVGHYKATNASLWAYSENIHAFIADAQVDLGTVEIGGEVTAVFTATTQPNFPDTEPIPFSFIMESDNNVLDRGTCTVRNACNVEFILNDQYGDGWNGNKLHVTYSDGTPAEYMTIVNGYTATFVRTIGKGVHVNVYFNPDTWPYECSYTIKYENGGIIHQEDNQQNYEFDVDCAGSANDPFSPVTDLAASVDGTNVTLTWHGNFASQRYRIARCGIVIAETEDTSFTDEIPYEQTNYSVTAIYSNGESLPENILVTVDLDVDENEAEFSIYPNPVNNTLNINGGDAKYSYVMYNGMGQQVANGTAQGAQQISVSGMAKGIYFIRLTAGSKTSVEKVVVK